MALSALRSFGLSWLGSPRKLQLVSTNPINSEHAHGTNRVIFVGLMYVTSSWCSIEQDGAAHAELNRIVAGPGGAAIRCDHLVGRGDRVAQTIGARWTYRIVQHGDRYRRRARSRARRECKSCGYRRYEHRAHSEHCLHFRHFARLRGSYGFESGWANYRILPDYRYAAAPMPSAVVELRMRWSFGCKAVPLRHLVRWQSQTITKG
jgi:hypothetical protein